MSGGILFVVIFLPFTILVVVDMDLKLPIPLPPNDVEENEERPPCPTEPNEVNPVTNEESPLPKPGNPPNAEKKGPAPLLLFPRVPLRFPKKSSNGSSKKSSENGSLPPKNSLKTSSGFQNGG
uniref:Uncharacterized protein n=1 Tax=Monodelphis domestica TaxID=13616 RepID=F6RP55_MONDO